jgi:hypothetical protein
MWLSTLAIGVGTLRGQAAVTWCLTGPASVIAAQWVTVLGYLAAARVDQQLALQPTRRVHDDR